MTRFNKEPGFGRKAARIAVAGALTFGMMVPLFGGAVAASAAEPTAPAAAQSQQTAAPAAATPQAQKPAAAQTQQQPAKQQAAKAAPAQAPAPRAAAPAFDSYTLAGTDGVVTVVAPNANNATITTDLNNTFGPSSYTFGTLTNSNGTWTVSVTLDQNYLSSGWTMVMSRFSWLTPPVTVTDFDKTWAGTNYTATFTYDTTAGQWKLTSPITLAAVAEAPKPTTVTVTFNTNGGSEVPAQTIESGSHVTNPDEPTRDGYTFTGWFTDEALTQRADLINSTFSKDTTIYAGWAKNEPEPETSYLHFYTDPDSESSDQSVLCTVGKPINQCYGFDDLQGTKDGYTFAGWYRDKALTDGPVDPATELAKGWAAYYAKWVENTPEADNWQLAGTDGNVVVEAPDANGATVETNLNHFGAGAYTFGQPELKGGVWTLEATLDQNDLSGGWTMVYTKFLNLTPSVKIGDFDKTWAGANYTATFTYDAEAKAWKLATPVKLAAKLSDDLHIQFITGEGGSSVDNLPFTPGQTVTAPAAPTRDGYTFAGWFTDKELTQAFDFGKPVDSYADVTLYAKWTKNEPQPTYRYDLSIAGDGVKDGKLTIKAGSSVKLTGSVKVTEVDGQPAAAAAEGTDGTADENGIPTLWTSSDPSVAAFDQDAKFNDAAGTDSQRLIALKAGKTTVAFALTGADGKAFATTSIEVTVVPAESGTANKPAANKKPAANNANKTTAKKAGKATKLANTGASVAGVAAMAVTLAALAGAGIALRKRSL